MNTRAPEQADSTVLLSVKSVELGKVVYVCNPSTWEADAGEAIVQDQP